MVCLHVRALHLTVPMRQRICFQASIELSSAGTRVGARKSNPRDDYVRPAGQRSASPSFFFELHELVSATVELLEHRLARVASFLVVSNPKAFEGVLLTLCGVILGLM